MCCLTNVAGALATEGEKIHDEAVVLEVSIDKRNDRRAIRTSVELTVRQPPKFSLATVAPAHLAEHPRWSSMRYNNLSAAPKNSPNEGVVRSPTYYTRYAWALLTDIVTTLNSLSLPSPTAPNSTQ